MDRESLDSLAGGLELRAELASLVEAFRGSDPFGEDDWVSFSVGDLWVLASVEEHKKRLRVRVYLQIDELDLVERWVAAQPAPRSGVLEVGSVDDGDWRPRLVFERALGETTWDGDRMFADVQRFQSAWLADKPASVTATSRSDFRILDDPRDKTPQSAWLLMGSEASFPDRAELDAGFDAARVGIFEWTWTTAAQTQIGDLALFYFISPRSAIHFVARAASDAYFTRDVEVNAERPVNPAQWWAEFTLPIEIEPISVAELREAAGGNLQLRGRSGHFVRPDVVERLRFVAKDPSQQPQLDRLLVVPIGLANLPDPRTMSMVTWRGIAAGALRLEADVSVYLVEPLLREVLEGTSMIVKGEHPVGKGWADFVVHDGERPVHVVEVKKVIKGLQGGVESSGDLDQLRRYMHQLDTPGILMDSHRLFLVARGQTAPYREINRTEFSDADMEALRAHIVDGGGAKN